MKPNPHLLDQALTRIGMEPPSALLVGDSITDVEASKRAGVVAVGYANRPGKVERLGSAEADHRHQHGRSGRRAHQPLKG
ncbi:HAD family hydrolase [Nonomuraea sp. NPDC002799]